MKKFLKLAAAVLLLAGAGQTLGAADYFARDFGAVPDGVTLNTVSIQAAIDFVSAHGGGRIVLDNGDYVSGSIYLKDGVTLWIDEDSSLLGSPESIDKLVAYTNAYMKGGGSHIQYNILDTDQLKEAKAHPENYADLIVRIGGFSAYFVQLSKGIQDDVIYRSEFEL